MEFKRAQLRSELSHSVKKIRPLLENKKSASYFALILTLVTLSFFGIFAVRPTLTTAITLVREIQDLRDLNDKYEEKITSIVKAQSEYEQIRDDIPLFLETLPSTPEFTKLIITEESIASASSVSIEKLVVDPLPISKPKEKGKLINFGMVFSLFADYPSFHTYLDHFLNSQRIVSIDEMQLSADEATSEGKLKILIKAKGYYEQ